MPGGAAPNLVLHDRRTLLATPTILGTIVALAHLCRNLSILGTPRPQQHSPKLAGIGRTGAWRLGPIARSARGSRQPPRVAGRVRANRGLSWGQFRAEFGRCQAKFGRFGPDARQPLAELVEFGPNLTDPGPTLASSSGKIWPIWIEVHELGAQHAS